MVSITMLVELALRFMDQFDCHAMSPSELLSRFIEFVAQHHGVSIRPVIDEVAQQFEKLQRDNS